MRRRLHIYIQEDRTAGEKCPRGPIVSLKNSTGCRQDAALCRPKIFQNNFTFSVCVQRPGVSSNVAPSGALVQKISPLGASYAPRAVEYGTGEDFSVSTLRLPTIPEFTKAVGSLALRSAAVANNLNYEPQSA